MFHTVGPRDKKIMKYYYKSCLQNVLTYDVKSVAFHFVEKGGIHQFYQLKAS